MTESSIAPDASARRGILQRIQERGYRAHVIVHGYHATRVFTSPNGEHLRDTLQDQIADAVRTGHALIDDDMRVLLTPKGEGVLDGRAR